MPPIALYPNARIMYNSKTENGEEVGATENLTMRLEGRDAMRALVAACDADAALLYACLAAEGGKISLGKASQAMRLDAARAKKAADLLVLYGLAADVSEPPPREDPEMAPAELAVARRQDAHFRAICDCADRAFGRVLRIDELRRLHAMYSDLGMSAEAMMLLFQHCRAQNMLTLRNVEKFAYKWADEGLSTYDEIERHIKMLEERSLRTRQIMRLLGIYDRKPSETEQKYLDKWVAQELANELLALAYDRTVTRCGKLEWRYMDKILQSWHEQSLGTRDEVERLDRPGAAKSAPRAETVLAAVTQRFEKKRIDRERARERRLAELRARDGRFAQAERDLNLCISKMARAEAQGDRDGATVLLRERERLYTVQAQILRDCGLPPDWLTDKPDCPRCGDRGYIGSSMCDCFERACREEEARRKGTKELVGV